MPATHEVLNQSAPLEAYNLFSRNAALADALAFNLPRARLAGARERLSALGAELGRRETLALADAANRYAPELKTHDARGRRRDEVEFHPAWHALMAIAFRHGLHSAPWSAPGAGAHVERAAGYLLYSEVENGTQCPVTMTYGAVPAIKADPRVAAQWLPRIYSREKDAALIGMGLTEKQGGSDVRTNTTRAVARGDGSYAITGHKWFLSAPMCDAFLVLAQAPGGLSCFFLPRLRADGGVNGILIQRLKDKLGNRSNASSEVEFEDAQATLLGEEGRGVPMILEMGVYTRLDCAIGTAGLMRQALAQALWNAAQRQAFGKLLRDQPLMKNVLADLALESEAATALVLRLSKAYDAEDGMLLRRVLTPAAKFWVCKRGSHFGQEAMEAVGGNGYVEEQVLARIYREMPLNSIWEGAGNVMCLDVLRALRKAPDVVAALAAELDAAAGRSHSYDAFCASLKDRLADAAEHESAARRLTQDLALALQASLLARHAPDFVFDAFVASRLGAPWTGAFGTLAPNAPFDALIARAMPA
ncbi:MAG: acyl-CoA dehydrogenase family protein [Betaproteobacteria bacterium]|nr:acyl-CoA dehydrogenase family protein [Betaproteobacteria bacterium]MDH5352423.1 acyl-CoA dehydrogenase family protein [Betaproteobacteria bacterium]